MSLLLDGQLAKAKVSLCLRKVLASFMTDRRIKSGNTELEMQRGYPQGSSLGPTLWLLAMQNWFAAVEHGLDGVKIQADADDQCIKLQDTSVKKIENKWCEVWGRSKRSSRTESKMSYKLAKTEMLFIPAGKKIRTPLLHVGPTIFRRLARLAARFYGTCRRIYPMNRPRHCIIG